MNNRSQNGYETQFNNQMQPQMPMGMPMQNDYNNQMNPMNGMSQQIPMGNDFNNQMNPMGGMQSQMPMGMPMQNDYNNQMNPMGGMQPQMPMGNDFNNQMNPMGGMQSQMPMGMPMQNDYNNQMNPMNGMPPQMPMGNDFNNQMNPMGGMQPQMPMGMPMQNDYNNQMNPMSGMQPQMPMGMPMQNDYNMQMNPMGGMQSQMPMGMPMQNDYNNQMNPMGGMQPQMPMGGMNSMRQTVIAVNCPKGGVGKTTISKELAIAFATTRVNGQPLKVCLVDGNLFFGDVTTMLKIQTTPNIKTWTMDIQQKLKENPDSFPRYSQQTIEENYLIQHSTGLYVLAAPASHSESLDIDAEQMGIVIDNLKECNFDVIIIDTANNTADYTLIALEKAQEILMISTMEVTAIQDTKNLIYTLREIQFPIEKIKLVINKMPPKTDKDIDVEEIAHVLQLPLLSIVPNFPKIRAINNGGEPAMLSKESEFTLAIKDLANKIVPIFPDVAEKNSKGKEKKKLFTGFGKK